MCRKNLSSKNSDTEDIDNSINNQDETSDVANEDNEQESEEDESTSDTDDSDSTNAPVDVKLEIYKIDVRQADLTLFSTPERKTVLIDSGD